MPNVTMGLRGKEDISRHDPGAGTIPQTFLRPNADPTLADVAVTKLSAADLPLIDAPVLSGAARPFAVLNNTQAEKQVDAALAYVRKNTASKKNFEAYGGVPGIGVSDAVAQKNTDVFNQIVTELAIETRYDGIFFPGTFYKFKDTGGAAILTIDGLPITLQGAGSQAILQAQNATAGFPLLRVIDGVGFRMVDLILDRVTNTADSFRMEASASPLGDVKLMNCKFRNGLRNVQIVGGGTTAEIDFWITGCAFENANAGALNLSLVDISGTHILNNVFSGTGTGLQHLASGTTKAMRDITMVENVFSGAQQSLAIMRLSTYNANNHRGVVASGNRISTGHLTCTGMNQVQANGNILYAGRISVILDMTTAQTIQLNGNHTVGSIFAGIELSGTNCTLEGFEIVGGSVRNHNQEGIKIFFSGAPAKWGRIENVLVHNCSREDTSAAHYAGIFLGAPNPTGGVQETVVAQNVIRSTSQTTTFNNMHKHGVQEQGGGVSDRNMIGPNYVKGYTTTDVQTTGVNSLDVVAALSAVAAAYGRYDGLAAI